MYRIVTEGEVTMANSTRGRQPKGSVCHSTELIVHFYMKNIRFLW